MTPSQIWFERFITAFGVIAIGVRTWVPMAAFWR